MIDESRDILTTFTDYSDETDVHFIDIPVSEGHPWIGLTVKDLNLPPGTLLVFLNHPGEKSTVPNGDTVLREGDVLVLGATAYAGKDDIHLTQIHVDDTHTWRDKRLCEIRLPKNSLIILVRRGGQTIIPNGDTKVLSGDELVCNTVH
jgi:cell volume regulation protein A